MIVPSRNTYHLSVEGHPSQQVAKSLGLNPSGSPVDRFIQDISSTLMRNHEVWIEVVYESWEEAGSLFSVFEVDGVKHAETGELVQDVPSQDRLRERAGTQNEGTAPIELDVDRMIRVSLPDEYPSEVISQVARNLSNVRSILMQPRFLESMGGKRPSGFSVKEATRAERLGILQAALPIGWAAREPLVVDAPITDYYHFWRELKFLHFRSLMRERAESALRQVLALASEQFDFSVEVWSDGIYTPEQVSEQISYFEAGNVRFETVLDMLYGKETGSDLNRRRIV